MSLSHSKSQRIPGPIGFKSQKTPQSRAPSCSWDQPPCGNLGICINSKFQGWNEAPPSLRPQIPFGICMDPSQICFIMPFLNRDGNSGRSRIPHEIPLLRLIFGIPSLGIRKENSSRIFGVLLKGKFSSNSLEKLWEFFTPAPENIPENSQFKPSWTGKELGLKR